MLEGTVASGAPAELPEGFKPTELGPLPEGWHVVALGKVVEKTPQTDPRNRLTWPFKYVDVSSVSNQSLRIEGFTEYQGADAPSRARKAIRTGDIIFATVRPYLKRTAMVPPGLDGQVCSTAFCVIRCKSEVAHPGFVFHAVGADDFVARVSEHQRGSSYPAVSDKDVLSQLIPLPPLDEQRAIAHVLSTIQRAIETTERVIAAARQLKRCLMRHLFTYGPVPIAEAERVPLKETEIGPVPEHWDVVRLGEVIIEGPQNGLYKPANLYGDGTPIVRITDFDNDGQFVTRVFRRVKLTAQEEATYELRQGDVLVNRVNSLSHLGKSALVPTLDTPAVFESNMMRFRVDERLASSEFVAAFLCLPCVRDSMRGMSKRAVAQSSINQGDVKSLSLPLPPMTEQKEVTRALRLADSKLKAEEKRRAALKELFRTMLHLLMTGQVRVKGLELGNGPAQ